MEDRMTRTERTDLIILICIETMLTDCAESLSGRVGNKPEWDNAILTARGCIKLMVDSVLATMNAEQLEHLKKTSRDYEMRLKPKLTPIDSNMVVDKETMRTLIDAAQYKCTDCFKSDRESRGCKLQKLLSVLIPMKKYDSGLCVFNNREWEN